MKVYRVTLSYHDGDHDHGEYCSPPFASRDLAEAFRDALAALPENDDRKWWSEHGCLDLGPEDASICEEEVMESLPEIKPAKLYLNITWT